MTEKTTQSEYGKLSSIVLKRPRDGFISQEKIDNEWKELNYLSPPSFEQACIDFEFIEKQVAGEGADILYLPDDPDLTLDSIYCRDASIATDMGMIICRMGKKERSGEPSAEKRIYEENGIPILGEIIEPGQIEGGDVVWLTRNVLAVGRGYRTNDSGIKQLKNLLQPYEIQVVTVELPHYKGEDDVFHLMSIISPVDQLKAVVYSSLMPVSFREYLLELDYSLIEVPESEFETLGCNVLAIAPGKCLIAKGNPITKERLLAAGCEVIEFDGTEISNKGCGGPTCLTRPIWREI